MAESGACDEGKGSLPGGVQNLPRVMSENSVDRNKVVAQNMNTRDCQTQGTGQFERPTLRRGMTEPILRSCEPSAASEFDNLFGRVPSDDFKTTVPKTAASAFDIFFGGRATVAEVGQDAPFIPDPSRPIDVVPSHHGGLVGSDKVLAARCRSRSEKLQKLVIPEAKTADPSDKPEHVDKHSPHTLLEGCVLHDSPPVPD